MAGLHATLIIGLKVATCFMRLAASHSSFINIFFLLDVCSSRFEHCDCVVIMLLKLYFLVKGIL